MQIIDKLRRKRKKSTFIKILEYAGTYLVIFITRLVPLKAVKIISNFLGDLLYLLSKKRRNIAIKNLQNAFKEENTGEEIRKIARYSCRSFLLTFLEIIKLRSLFKKPGSASTFKNLEELFHKAKKIHDDTGGCIFVTPHIGSWELLSHLISAVGIPIAIVARPIDNEYLEKLIYANRAASGQVIIPKKNALFALRENLRQGKSVGMLPDQSTMKGLSINFFGHKATTTPVPAILAINYKRPIVVAACCRKLGDYQYEGFICDPIWPGENSAREISEDISRVKSEKAEIFRLTEDMNQKMESIIRKYPEQYLWIHNRWKTYKGKREIFS